MDDLVFSMIFDLDFFNYNNSLINWIPYSFYLSKVNKLSL